MLLSSQQYVFSNNKYNRHVLTTEDKPNLQRRNKIMQSIQSADTERAIAPPRYPCQIVVILTTYENLVVMLYV